MQGAHGSDRPAQPRAEPDAENGRQKRGRPLIFVVLGLAIVGACGVLVSRHAASNAAARGAAASASPQGRVVPVVSAFVTKRDVPIYLDAIGNATPLATVTVRPQVDGRLDKVLFKEGQAVKKGELLAQIDPRPFNIALHQAQAAMARDRADQRNAGINLERYQNLVKGKLIPQQQVDDQQTMVEKAKAAVDADRAQIESARLQLDYAAIKSPLAGVTGVRLVDPGNIVHAADPGGIVVVTELDPMAVLFTLPQDDLPRVTKKLAEGPLSVQAFSRDGATNVGTGTLEVIDNEVNQETATIRLKALFPNKEHVLWPKAFLKVRLLLTTRKDALVVPSPAIQRGPDGSFVYVIDGANAVAVRPVEVDREENESDWTIITSGLSVGEQVVVEGQSQLRPGAKVAPRASTPASRTGVNGTGVPE